MLVSKCVCSVNAVGSARKNEEGALVLGEKKIDRTALSLSQKGWVALILASATGCGPWNQGLEEDLSKTPMVCKDGVKYLPYTNASDEAYTSEGRPETCPRDL